MGVGALAADEGGRRGRAGPGAAGGSPVSFVVMGGGALPDDGVKAVPNEGDDEKPAPLLGDEAPVALVVGAKAVEPVSDLTGGENASTSSKLGNLDSKSSLSSPASTIGTGAGVGAGDARAAIPADDEGRERHPSVLREASPPVRFDFGAPC